LYFTKECCSIENKKLPESFLFFFTTTKEYFMPNKAALGGVFLCHEVPGHSGCRKKIDGNICPSRDGSADSTSCHGHSHNPQANLQQALQWIHESKSPQVQTVGFVTKPSDSFTWPKVPH
jgi:hypothetical protein